jgi:hypothetical protein
LIGRCLDLLRQDLRRDVQAVFQGADVHEAVLWL